MSLETMDLERYTVMARALAEAITECNTLRRELREARTEIAHLRAVAALRTAAQRAPRVLGWHPRPCTDAQCGWHVEEGYRCQREAEHAGPHFHPWIVDEGKP